MSWFEECEEHIIDGRHIYVCSKKPEYIKLYTPWIIKICSSRKGAKFFPALWFSLEEEPLTEKIPPAYIFFDEVVTGILKIHLTPSKIPNFETLDVGIIHELTHIWHNYLTQWILRYTKSNYLLHQATEKLLLNELQKPNLPNFRKLLSLFVWELHSEGLAQFSQSYAAKEIVFSESLFLKLYQKGRLAALNLNRRLMSISFNEPVAKQELAACFRGPQYSIGLHMVYSILFLNPDFTSGKITLGKIAKMHHFTFIKKYEACMLKRGLKPVVSLTSGAGDFDYKQSLQQWWKAVKG